jgi:hypothetical protein
MNQKNTVHTPRIVLAPLFISFAYSIAGWGLLELWLFQIGAGFRAHAMAAVFTLWLVFMSIRRPRIGRIDPQSDGTRTAGQFRGFVRADAGWALLFLVAGSILGALVVVALTVVLTAGALILVFIPWSRVRFCRNHFLAACTALWTGILLIVGPHHSQIDRMFLPIACWVLWTVSGYGLILRIAQLSRAERATNSSSPVPDALAPSDTPV